MKTKTIVFAAAVFFIILVLLFSDRTRIEVCNETQKTFGDYEDILTAQLQNSSEQSAIGTYTEAKRCFETEKERLVKPLLVYYSNKFAQMQIQENHDNVIEQYKQLKIQINELLLEQALEPKVLISYQKIMQRYEPEIKAANFVTNTTTQVLECKAYINSYEDLKATLLNIDKQQLFDIENVVQICYVLQGNLYRYTAKTQSDINKAIDSYQKATALQIINPVYSHADKLITEFQTCGQREGKCMPKEIKGSCKEILGPTTGWTDCTQEQICCKALI